MPHCVYVIAEFSPKKNHEQEFFGLLNELGAQTLESEEGCLRYLVTQQILHPRAPGHSKYKIVSIEEFANEDAFDNHCKTKYVTDFIQKYIESKDTGIVDDVCVRLFSIESDF